MAALTYADFEVTIRPMGDQYQAEVHAPDGSTPIVNFPSPFTLEDIAVFRDSLGQLTRDARPAGSSRARLDAELKEKVRSFGRRLYDAVFQGDIRTSLQTNLQKVDETATGLRIRLRLIDVPELAEWPWEYLFDSSDGHYFAIKIKTPIVRYPLRSRMIPLAIEPPLNILVMIAKPNGYAELDVNQEWQKIDNSLDLLQKANKVTIDRLPSLKPDGPTATLSGLRYQLSQKNYHIFHFIGHGGFDPGTHEGGLIIEDDKTKEGKLIDPDLFTNNLDHPTLRLAILNSCEGARADLKSSFAGVAQKLVQQGLPAVIAMQFKITDPCAITFAEKFYQSLADGNPLESALVEARIALYSNSPIEWGTPVLFMRTIDGGIFNIKRPSAEEQRQANIERWTSDATAAIARKDYQAAIDRLQEILALLQPGTNR